MLIILHSHSFHSHLHLPIPPSPSQLLKPSPVRLVNANQHTLWVEWDRVRWDADDTRLNPRTTPVTYYLYVRIGYQGLLVGDRWVGWTYVRVVCCV